MVFLNGGVGPFAEWSRNYPLLRRLVVRDIRGRYQGSVFGTFWSIGTPLFLLFAYWFVLGVVLQARWGHAPSKLYPAILFSGLIIHLFCAEVWGRAPMLIIDNKTYVKKVVFPLATLSWMSLATAVFQLCVNLSVLFVGQVLMARGVPATWPLVFLVVIPLLPMLLGISWFLSSLGVYLRDVQQVIPLLLTMMMFLSPIFFPIELVPDKYRAFMYANPLTLIILQVRAVTIEGHLPDFMSLAIYTACGTVVMYAGYWWFCRTQKGFADVL
jgi:lipopolysaccharide transport system permease protein